LGLSLPIMKGGTGIERESPQVPRQKKITAAVLKKIPTLIERGISPAEIAARLGCTTGTLRVLCSKAKISLRKRKSGEHRPSSDIRLERIHHATPLNLPETVVRRLRQEAVKRGLSVATFTTMLLKMIVQDELYDAVLDEREAHKRGYRQGSS